jgi:hypothetical protein
VRPEQLARLAGQARDVGTVHTAVDELIRMVNVTRVWRHWSKPVLIVVSRDAPHHYAYLREAFGAVPWAEVVCDRRAAARSGDDRESARLWVVVHGDRVGMDAEAVVGPRERRHALSALPDVLKWAWSTGWKIGEYAGTRALVGVRG